MARKKRPDLPGGVHTEANGPLTDDGPADEFVGPPPPRDEPGDEPDQSPAPAPTPPPAAIPVASIATAESLLEDRLSKLEVTLTQLAQIEQRLKDIQNAPVAAIAPPPMAVATAPSEKNSLLWSAASLLSPVAGLLPSILTKGDPNRSRDPFSLSETVAELRAMQRMFVDPRYSMSWLGRAAPLLLLAFLFPSVWMPGATVLAWLVCPVGQLAVGFALFKILAREARRYREKAPDLPPSLRL
ncbi:MAG: hypothetical protein ACRC33_28350 [Gemmataceae bacterium]